MRKASMRSTEDFAASASLRTGRGSLRFTLVELLVVIAIMSVLASLLLPALSRARCLASDLGCKSNERQIGVAHSMYLNDSNGVVVLCAKNDEAVSDIPKNWCSFLGSDGSALGSGSPGPYGLTWWSGLSPERKFGRKNVFMCPRRANPVDKSVAGGFWISHYAGNQYLMGVLPGASYLSHSISCVLKPSSVVLCKDNESPSDLGGDQNASYYGMPYGGTGFIHGSGVKALSAASGVSNILYIDGHVGQMNLLQFCLTKSEKTGANSGVYVLTNGYVNNY